MFNSQHITQGRPNQFSPQERTNGDTNNMTDEEKQINQILSNMKTKYAQLDYIIQAKIEEREHTFNDINVLSQRLNLVTNSLMKKRTAYEHYDRTLRDADSAYINITESTGTLLNLVKNEIIHINKVVKL